MLWAASRVTLFSTARGLLRVQGSHGGGGHGPTGKASVSEALGTEAWGCPSSPTASRGQGVAVMAGRSDLSLRWGPLP